MTMKAVTPDEFDEELDLGTILIDGGPEDFQELESVLVQWTTRGESVGMVRAYNAALGKWMIQTGEQLDWLPT